ncbi:MAG: PAS domain S-box protein [Armatimonadetes bacterium]|nr:PAS domain S-box protein [Armatimonadota bacterium]
MASPIVSGAELPVGEDRYRVIVETTHEGIWLVDGAWRTSFVNAAMAAMLGYEPAEMIGHLPTDYVDDDVRDELRALAARREQGVTETHEFRFRRRDGRPLWTLVCTSPISAADGSFAGALAMVTDITERQKAETQRRLLQHSLDHAAHSVVWMRPDGSYAYVNEAAASLLDYTREELLSLRVYDVNPIMTPERFAALWERLRAERALTYDVDLVRRDGTPVPLEATLSYLAFEGEEYALGFSVEIGERRRNEAVMAARLRLLALAETHCLADLLRATLDEAEALTGSQIGFYHFVDDDQLQLSLQQWSTNTVAHMCTAEGAGSHYPVSEAGVWADCLRERQPVIHNDYAALEHRRGLPDGHAAVVRELVVPVLRGERVAAILGVGNKPTDYTQTDVLAVSALADLAWTIAEHKRAEEALAASAALLDATQSISLVGGWEWDIAAQRMLWTDETYRLHGLTPGWPAVGSTEHVEVSAACYPGAAREAVLQAFQRCAEHGEPYDLELPFVNTTGRAMWVRTTGQPVWADGRVVKLVGNLVDITAQKAAEAELQLKSNVLDQIQDHVLVTDLTGRITYANDTQCQSLGRDRSQLIGHPVHVLGEDPEQGATQDHIIAETLAHGAWRGEVVNRAADGAEHIVYCRTQVVRDSDGEVVALSGVGTDITERKRIEDALRASEAFGRDVLDSLTAHIAVLDGDGTVVAVNDAWRRFAEANGCRAKNVAIGANYLAVCRRAADAHSDRAQEALDALQAVLSGQAPSASVEYSCHSPQEQRWFCMHIWPLSGARAGVVVAHENITQQRLAGQALAHSEALHRDLLAGLPDLVIRFDRDGRHLFASPNIAEVFGQPAEWFLGHTHSDLRMDPALSDFWARSLAEVVATGQPSEAELSMATPHGPAVHNLRLVPERDADGEVESVLAICRDITEHRRIEENYRTLFREMLDGFALHEIVCDEQGRPCDYRFITVNPAFERLTGLHAEQLVGRTVLEVMPGTEQHWIDTYGRVALTGEPAFFENYSAELAKHFEVTAYRPAPGQFACIFVDVTERRRAEDALRESQAMLNLVLDTVPQSVFWKDPVGRYLGCNQVFARAAGFASPAEVVGRTDDDMPWPPHEAEAYRADDLEVLRTGRAKMHIVEPLQQADGARLWIDTSKVPLLDDQGVPFAVLGVYQDITERRQAEEAVRRSTIVLERTFEQSPVAMVLVSLPDAVLRIINPACLRLLGVEDEPSAVGTRLLDIQPSWRDFTADGHEQRLDQLPLARSLRGETTTGEERYIIRKDGSIAHELVSATPILDANGEPIAALLIMMDITAQKQADAALRVSEARFRDLLQHVPSVAVQGYAPDGTTQYWNKASEALYGYTAEEAIGANLLDLIIPPEMRDDVRGAIDYMAETGEAIPSAELTLMRRDGSRVAVYSSHVIVRVPGREQELFCIDVDLTERNRAEEARATLEAQLGQAQKMESVGRLAGGVAHDFNNMLGVILGHTEMALDQVPEGELLHEDLEEVQKAAQRSADLARQLLAFARKQTIAPTVLDLNETVGGLHNMLQRMVGENLCLTWQPAAALWPVKMDASQLNQMLTNLCVNARDAVNDVGEITIETANEVVGEADGPVPPGEWVKLTVRDDGCGMDAETLSHIFEPFFTTKAVGVGSGLGLATVYGAVRQNGGHITVTSQPGRGTIFAIYLPRHRGPAELVEADPDAEPTPSGQETILLVEDEPAILRMTARILRGKGYTVLPAATPGEAMALARSHPGRLHLLLTDVVMPEMNGRELARQVQLLHPGVRRVFMSGYTADTIAHHGVLEEGVHFIQKPFAAKTLLTKVAEALAAE